LLSAQLADDKLTFDSENGREANPRECRCRQPPFRGRRFDCTIGSGLFFGKAMSVLTRTRAFDRLRGFFVCAGIP
jgi:hypothetical protein